MKKMIAVFIAIQMLTSVTFAYHEKDINWIDPVGYDRELLESQGPFLYIEDGKAGYINDHGAIVIAPKAEIRDTFSNGVAVVSSDGKYGRINAKGEEIVGKIYDNMQRESEGLLGVSLDGKSGYINTKGEVVIALEYEYVGAFEHGASIVYMEADEMGALIDTTGKLLTEFKYGDFTYYRDGYFSHAEGYVDFLGQEYENIDISPYYDDLEGSHSHISNDIHMTTHYADESYTRLFGFSNREGMELVPPIYDDAICFSENRGFVLQNEKWAMLDETGAFLTKFIFDEIMLNGDLQFYDTGSVFVADRVIVKKDGLLHVIDKTGAVIHTFEKKGKLQ